MDDLQENIKELESKIMVLEERVNTLQPRVARIPRPEIPQNLGREGIATVIHFYSYLTYI